MASWGGAIEVFVVAQREKRTFFRDGKTDGDDVMVVRNCLTFMQVHVPLSSG